MFAVAGVTGRTGAVAADRLLAQGHAVRVIVRDAAKGAPWAARGAEVAVAELGDAERMTAALAGTAGAYLLVPPALTSPDPITDNARIADALGRAVRAARVPHVVFLSSVGAQHDAGTGPIRSVRIGEQALAATGAATTFVRAAYFLENWHGSLGMVGQGVLPTFLPTGLAFPQVATRDIGATAATALAEGPHGAQVIELSSGPTDYSSDDVAAVLSRLVGAPVAAHHAPLDAVVPTFLSFGLTPAFAALYRELFEGVIEGRVAFEGGAARRVRGPTLPAEVLGAALPRPA
jgi:uncharacterized protein YbjT (DUF2867 family)